MVSLLLLTYCGIGLIGPQGLVLCLGQDGHVAVEAAPMGIYCGVAYDESEVGEKTHLTGDIQVHESHCGSCDDTALAFDSVRVESSRDLVDPIANSAFVVAPSLYHTPETFSTKVNRSSRKDSIAVFPLFLRTTILLI